MKKTLTLEAISRQQKNGSKGPFTSVGIKTKEYGDRWLNGFGNNENNNWQKGDIVTIDVVSVTKDGKEYLNFKPCIIETNNQNTNVQNTNNQGVNNVENSNVSEALKAIYKRIEEMEMNILEKLNHNKEDIKADDIPF